MNKLVPVVCPFCGAGCGMYLQCHNDSVIVTAPSDGDAVSEGRLCIRGWQVGDLLHNSHRLTSPLINGSPASWSEAMARATQLLEQLSGSRVGILAAGHLTSEEGFAVSYFGRQVLGTVHLDNFGRMVDGPALWGLQYSLGQPYQRPPLNDLVNYDLILCLNSNLRELNPQAGAWVHKAQQAGAKLVVIDEVDDGLGQDADVYVQHAVRAEAAVLQQLAKSLHGEAELPLDVAQLGPETLAESLKQTTDMIRAASRVAIVLSARASSIPEPAMMAAEIAKEINTARPGAAEVFAVGGTANCVGLINMGLVPPEGDQQKGPALALGEMLARDQQNVDGLIVIGEELSAWLGEAGLAALADRLKALIVLESYRTPTSQIADVALPMAAFGEKEGSFTGLDGMVRWCGQVAPPVNGCQYLPRIFSELATQLGREGGPVEIEAIWGQINQQIPGYKDIKLNDLRQGGQPQLGQTALHQRTGPVDTDYQPSVLEKSEQRPYILRSRYDADWWIYDGRVRAVPALYREARDLQAGYALMNPADMEKEQLRPGRTAIVQTAAAGARLLVYPQSGIPEGLIVLPSHQLKFLQRLMGFGEYDRDSGAIYRCPVAAAVKRG